MVCSAAMSKAARLKRRKSEQVRRAAAPEPLVFTWRHTAVALGLALALFGVGCSLVWAQVPIDDSFISFRYARNLATGQGLVFNPGERVEGFSSLSWVLLLAAGHRLGLDLPLLAKGLGVLLGAGTLLLLGASRDPARPLAALLLALSLPFTYHALNGLETALFAFLLTALIVVSGESSGPRRVRWVVAILLVLTRPEGFLAVLLWNLCLWIAGRARLLRRSAEEVGAAALAFLAQLLWRCLYYHDWLANSARAKMLPLDFALPPGLLDLARFLWTVSGWGLLLACAALAVTGAARGPRGVPGETWPPLRALALFVIGFGVALASSGGDSFPLWRFFVPLLPLFFLLAGEGLVWLGDRASRASGLRPVAIAVAVGIVLANAASKIPEQVRAIAGEGQWVHLWAEIGESLRAAVPPGTRIALCPVGALPYYSGLPTVDMLGLTDPHIARVPADRTYFYPGHHRYDGAYVLARRPELILLANGPVVSAPQPFPGYLTRRYERDVALSADFQRDYSLVHLPLRTGGFVQIFARSDFTARLPG